jgi:hypothetical protein
MTSLPQIYYSEVVIDKTCGGIGRWRRKEKST